MYYDRHPTETDGCIPVLAAQVGFEPTGVLPHNGFQDRALIATWVLCHVAGRYRPALYGKERKKEIFHAQPYARPGGSSEETRTLTSCDT